MKPVNIDGLKLIDHSFDRRGNHWNALTLIEAAKDLEEFDMPLIGIDISAKPWGSEMNIKDFVYHAKRIENTDLQYPVLMDDEGYICDGWHRVCKALLQGHTTIRAKRFEAMPAPDSIDKT